MKLPQTKRAKQAHAEYLAERDALWLKLMDNARLVEKLLRQYPDDARFHASALRTRSSVMDAAESQGRPFVPYWSIGLPLPPPDLCREIDGLLCASREELQRFGF